MSAQRRAAPARYIPPGWFARNVLNRLASLSGVPVLAVRGRSSGEWRTVPVNVLEHDGARYLVAPRGETDWVRNLRAAGQGELRRRGWRERIRATEVSDEQKPAIVDAYRARWDRQVRKQFDALPDLSAHPVFRIEAQPSVLT